MNFAQWAYIVEQAEERGLDTRPGRPTCIWGLRSDGLLSCLIHKDTIEQLEQGQQRMEAWV